MQNSDENQKEQQDGDDGSDEDETDERKKIPEDISKVLESHGGSLNLKEFTNVKESAEKHYFLVTNGNGDIVSLKKIVLLAFER
ncbi:hypothetical protein Bhyg_13275 [Pseudolycoriella hygida]|uniref:Uncharacterized protein n=1 Tax=Pseudolycoriella hygida TaxID=35572 RepID=A0A9Q0MMH8_9DIPT|nr:hypothetical protein Bhyg_13275 [Pseudolycoriella hygida]